MRSTYQGRQGSLLDSGISRRKFLKFCSLMTATLALQETYVNVIAKALAASPRLPVIWLAASDCTGDTESFLRSFDPSISDLLLNIISLDYHESLMVPSGGNALKSLDDTISKYSGQYVCILEGAIPMGNPGYCTVGGESIVNIVKKVAGSALLNIAAGSCSFDGGIVAAAPNPTGATGLQGAVPNARNLINMPGCPVNGVNLVAAIVFWLTYKQLPPLDSLRRPLFAYGHEIHHEGNCERYSFYEADLFVQNWGDEGHKKGYCLKNMGCRGPIAHSNCYTRNWNQNTSWPIGAGHGCIGCTEAKFWDKARNTSTGDKGSIYKVIDD